MKSEAYINKILEETGLSRKEIQDLVEEKKVELKGLISDEGALFIIAKELGVDVQEENKEYLKDLEINTSDIHPNMKNITLIGRIKEIYDLKSFTRKGAGDKGYVGSFLLSDSTGDIRIVLWDENTNIYKDIHFDINEMVKILNGYAKQGQYGGIEIHMGRFSKVILSPEDVDYSKYPKIAFKTSNIVDINLNLKSVSIEGRVIQKWSIKEFTRKDGEIGKVGSLSLLDSTGTIRVTFWNEDTEKIRGINDDDIISISTLSPRLSKLDSKTIDLFANKGTIIKKIDKKIQIESQLGENIKVLQNQNGMVSFKGKITSVDNLKKVELKSGESISLLGFKVSDETDEIRITLWSDKAEEYSEQLSVGKGVFLKNVLIKYSNFSKRNEISLINESEIEFIELDIEVIKKMEQEKGDFGNNFTGNYTNISLINSVDIYEIKGFIAKLNSVRTYEACSKCNRKYENCNCNEKGTRENRLITSLTIDDGSSTIRATFFGDKAEKILGVDANIIAQIKDTPDFDKSIELKSNEILGKDIIIRGRAKFNDYIDGYDLNVNDSKELNVQEELEKTMNQIEI